MHTCVQYVCSSVCKMVVANVIQLAIHLCMNFDPMHLDISKGSSHSGIGATFPKVTSKFRG